MRTTKYKQKDKLKLISGKMTKMTVYPPPLEQYNVSDNDVASYMKEHRMVSDYWDYVHKHKNAIARNMNKPGRSGVYYYGHKKDRSGKYKLDYDD